MPPDPRLHLEQVADATALIDEFLSGKSQTDYVSDVLTQSAVAWQLVIVGEAIKRIADIAPQLAAGITDYAKIIGLRNILVHGYAEVDPHLVWDTLRLDLGRLRGEVAALLAEE